MKRFELVVALLLVSTAMLFADSAAGLHWTMPAGWKSEAPRPMRAATYTISPAQGDTAGGECIINYFGPGQGGSVEANIDRWKSQMLGQDGKPTPANVAKRSVRGISMTTVDAAGTYTGMGGPMAMSSKPVAGYRLLGAIVEGPQGTLFIKLTGPAKTVAANTAKFDQLLASIARD